jgi:hypothetical protein
VPAANAEFVQQSIAVPNIPMCDGLNNLCLSGFDGSKVNAATDELKDDSQISLHQVSFQN